MPAVLAEPNTWVKWVKWEMVSENAAVRERLSPDGEALLVATGFDERPTADEVRAVVEAHDRSVLSYMSLSA